MILTVWHKPFGDNHFELGQPFRTSGYPLTPVLFVVGALVIVANALVVQPAQSLIGLGLTALGLPAYFVWRTRPASSME